MATVAVVAVCRSYEHWAGHGVDLSCFRGQLRAMCGTIHVGAGFVATVAVIAVCRSCESQLPPDLGRRCGKWQSPRISAILCNTSTQNVQTNVKRKYWLAKSPEEKYSNFLRNYVQTSCCVVYLFSKFEIPYRSSPRPQEAPVENDSLRKSPQFSANNFKSYYSRNAE